MALSLDRKAFIDILSEGQGEIGGDDAAAARGVVGHAARSAEVSCRAMTPRSRKTAREARDIMEKLGYGPDKRLEDQGVDARHPDYRDPAVILIDQLKEIYIDGELETIDTVYWYPKIYAQGLHRRSQRNRKAGRRPRPAILDETLPMRFEPELERLLQPRGRQADRAAID